MTDENIELLEKCVLETDKVSKQFFWDWVEREEKKSRSNDSIINFIKPIFDNSNVEVYEPFK